MQAPQWRAVPVDHAAAFKAHPGRAIFPPIRTAQGRLSFHRGHFLVLHAKGQRRRVDGGRGRLRDHDRHALGNALRAIGLGHQRPHRQPTHDHRSPPQHATPRRSALARDRRNDRLRSTLGIRDGSVAIRRCGIARKRAPT